MGFTEIIKGFIALVFLQSSWSYLGRQTLGILSAIILLGNNKTTDANPEPSKDQLKDRIWQKLSINTNPYCIAVMVGIAFNRKGEIFDESYFSLQHIFGAIGDEFFWRTFRPTLLSLTILFLLIGYFLSANFNAVGIFKFTPLVFLIPYNIIAQGTRIRGLSQGKKYGKQAAIFLIENLRKPIPNLYKTLAFIMGILVILLPAMFLSGFSQQIDNTIKAILSVISILSLIILAYIASRTERTSSYLLIGGLLIFLIIKVL